MKLFRSPAREKVTLRCFTNAAALKHRVQRAPLARKFR